MVQRCHKDTHVSSARYKLRGIKVEFSSRREFCLWAVQTWPEESFEKKDFDRIDNAGNYSKTNLRVVDRATNLLNRDCMPEIHIGHARKFMEQHPDISYTERTVLGLIRCGLPTEEILRRHACSQKAGWRKSMI
jgi:hypothetical protein